MKERRNVSETDKRMLGTWGHSEKSQFNIGGNGTPEGVGRKNDQKQYFKKNGLEFSGGNNFFFSFFFSILTSNC